MDHLKTYFLLTMGIFQPAMLVYQKGFSITNPNKSLLQRKIPQNHHTYHTFGSSLIPTKWSTSNDPWRFVLFLPNDILVAQPVNYWPWIDQLPRLRHQWCYSWKSDKNGGKSRDCFLVVGWTQCFLFPKLDNFPMFLDSTSKLSWWLSFSLGSLPRNTSWFGDFAMGLLYLQSYLIKSSLGNLRLVGGWIN